MSPLQRFLYSKFYFIAVALLVSFPDAGHCQNDERFRVDVDLASFYFGDDTTFVELYYAFPRSVLSYEYENGLYKGAALLNVTFQLEDAKRDPVFKAWRVPIELADTANLEQHSLIGRVGFLLAPGRYSVVLIARDENQQALSDSVERRYDIRSFTRNRSHFSDIELASSIRQAEEDESNIFYKNTLEVIPNPALIYGSQLPTVLYYSELYNIDTEHFIVKNEIVSSYGRTMVSTSKRRSGSVPSRVEVGAVNIAALPSGVYTLILSYGDTTGQMKLSQSKQFYVFNPDVPLDTIATIEVADLIAAEFTAMSESELDEQFALATYICTKDERNIWKSLSGSEAKRKFITKFWRDRDPDLVTPNNEAYELYKQLVASANEQFRTPYRKGWKSDRGRVYILYGPPDYVERRSNEADMKPHEIWRYDSIEGGVEFVFVDRGGFNDYELVHSTKRNEINNIDWQRNASTH